MNTARTILSLMLSGTLAHVSRQPAPRPGAQCVDARTFSGMR
jgi:hypothetical protein